MEFKKWLDTFIEEKTLGYKNFEIKINENIHFIDNEQVIKLIKSASKDEQQKIKEILVKIDFIHTDINNYLKFLAECYIKANYYN